VRKRAPWQKIFLGCILPPIFPLNELLYVIAVSASPAGSNCETDMEKEHCQMTKYTARAGI